MKSNECDGCSEFLIIFRKKIKANSKDRIYKRYYRYFDGWLASDGNYYNGHCAYCAEITFLNILYKSTNIKIQDVINQYKKDKKE